MKKNLTVRIKTAPGVKKPTYATEASAGMDLRANNTISLPGHNARRLVKTGVFIELPVGYEAQVRPRSGIAYRKGISVLNAPGTIDADYRGEIGVILINTSNIPVLIEKGDRIAQLVVAKHEVVQWEDVETLEESERGTGGFGSTGR